MPVEAAGPIGTKFGTHVQINLGMDIRQTNCPSRHKGAHGGLALGGQTFKSLEKNDWTDWHQLWFTSVDSSGSGHRLNTSRSTIPQGILGGFRGSQIQMSGEDVKRLDRLTPTFGTCLRIRLGMDIAKYISPLNSTGDISGGFRGVTNLSLGNLPNGWTDWHQIRNTSVDSSGNGHRLKTIRPTIPHGGILGGFRGSTIGEGLHYCPSPAKYSAE